MQALQTLVDDLYPETLLVQVKDGKAFTNSLIVAKWFHKLHKNVLQRIETLIFELEDNGLGRLNFQPTLRSDKWNRDQIYYELDRDAFMFLAMRLGGKDAMRWQLDFIKAFNAMEIYIHAEANRRASALALLKPNLIIIEDCDKLNMNRAQIAEKTGHKCLGSITAGRKRARDLGLDVKPARSKKAGAA